MRSILKNIIATTYKPFLVKYLSRTRTYVHKGMVVQVPSQVFHPKFFFSTKLLLQYLTNLHLKDKLFLELGAGSGLISVYASMQKANVTASDINPVAIEALKTTRNMNGVDFDIVYSDLFETIPPQLFDVIAINPPYYKRKPLTQADYAWYCGENGEYFQKLFTDLKHFIHQNSVVLMVLCDGCDLKMIQTMARLNGFEMNCVFRKKNLLEENFIYSIELRNE
jgi:release factor glutamine methyltransferase